MEESYLVTRFFSLLAFYMCHLFCLAKVCKVWEWLHAEQFCELIPFTQLFKATYGTSYVYLGTKIATRGRAYQFRQALF